MRLTQSLINNSSFLALLQLLNQMAPFEKYLKVIFIFLTFVRYIIPYYNYICQSNKDKSKIQVTVIQLIQRKTQLYDFYTDGVESFLKIIMGCCLSPQQNKRAMERLQQGQTPTFPIQKDGKQDGIIRNRERLQCEILPSDDFLIHHLQNELSRSPHSSSKKIRNRQILEHVLLGNIMRMGAIGQPHPTKFIQFTLKAWFMRTFIDALDNAEKGYLDGRLSYNEMKEQLTEEYIFELYQLGTFIKAGLLKFSTKDKQMDIPLSVILLHSDSALFPLLQKLQSKYPLVSEDKSLIFPEVKEVKSKLNILTLINSKSFADLDNLNIQTTMDDLRFLIDTANQNYPDFKNDMEIILQGAQTDCKVKWMKHEGEENHHYVATAVRRVFIKWTQTLIERIPDVYSSKEFLSFLECKKIMGDEYVFKGMVSPTTHHQVIQKLTQLLESLKCKIGTKIPQPEFGLFLYDLLRCKTTRKTPEEVVDLLEKLKKITKTPSGKRFEVMRIKNRFKWATRDLLINFRYGQHLIGEVQLCVDVSHEDLRTSKLINLRHLLYEFERGLFGPTFEMIMQFEDFTRTDIEVSMQSEGLVYPRRLQGQSSSDMVKRANRVLIRISQLCPQNHQMIAVSSSENISKNISSMMEGKVRSSLCHFCYKLFSLQTEFHYCYYCSIFYCLKCQKDYAQADKEQLKLTCLNQQIIKEIVKPEQIINLCSFLKAIVVVVYQEGSVPSQLFLDQIVLLLSSYELQKKPIPPIYKINAGTTEMKKIVDKYHIQRTPTTLLLDQKQELQITLEGCTFQDIQSIFQIQTHINQGLPKALQIKCQLCNSSMSVSESLNPDQRCFMCMNINKVEGLRSIVRKIKGNKKDYVCPHGHLRCNSCSYLSSNEPSYFRDCTGKSYLSTILTNKPIQCTKEHKMELIPLSDDSQAVCQKCKLNLQKKSGEEVGYCLKCKEYSCIDCKETEKVINDTTNKQKMVKSMEIVSHFVQNKLEEGYPCGCGKYFQRVYQSQKINSSKFDIKEILQAGVVSWTCWVCKKEENKLKLHLACFFCFYAQQVNRKVSHLEICLECALKSGILEKKPRVKAIREQTQLTCTSGHPTILTSVRVRDSVAFACFYCRKLYYPFSERYECETCKIMICLDCSERHLTDNKPLSTKQVCTNGHSLIPKKKSPQLQFCSLCSVYLKQKYFECPSRGCKFCLCLQCAAREEKTKL